MSNISRLRKKPNNPHIVLLGGLACPFEDATWRSVDWQLLTSSDGGRWFVITMGTGIVSILLNQFPYKARWLYWLSVIVFVVNLALFILFVGLSLLRYALWPHTRRITANQLTQALYLSTIPTVGQDDLLLAFLDKS